MATRKTIESRLLATNLWDGFYDPTARADHRSHPFVVMPEAWVASLPALTASGLPPGARGRTGVPLRAVAALAAGYGLYLSLPPQALWWLGLLGFALLGLALRGRRGRAVIGYALLSVMGFLVPLLS